MKHTEPERDFKDPVCGMRVSRLTAVADAEHGQKRYYFCAVECRDAFLAEHRDLGDVAFWQGLQAQHAAGQWPDFEPYPQHLRFA